MKRPLLVLALPLVLAAIMFGVKWRADHPTPTKEDLAIRALMKQPSFVYVSQFRTPSGKRRRYQVMLSRAESNSLADDFYLWPHPNETNKSTMSGNNNFSVQFFLKKPQKTGILGVFAFIDVDGQPSVVAFGNFTQKILHPVTAKRWIERLLSHPRVGPALRAQMNP